MMAKASCELEKLRQSHKGQRDKKGFRGPVVAELPQLIDNDGNLIDVENGKTHNDCEYDANEPDQIAKSHVIPQVFRLVADIVSPEPKEDRER